MIKIEFDGTTLFACGYAAETDEEMSEDERNRRLDAAARALLAAGDRPIVSMDLPWYPKEGRFYQLLEDRDEVTPGARVIRPAADEEGSNRG